MPETEFTIHPDGHLTSETTGQAGPSCEQILRQLEEFLGQPAVDCNTPEYYAVVQQRQQQQLRQGR